MKKKIGKIMEISQNILNFYLKYVINILSGAQETFEALSHFYFKLEFYL